ncbi:MAG: N-6 DNA methylase [Bacteroidales bacterium]|nr:N-6 DNA methylase [Bacteroidales bacterium]MCF8390737.1 N-6 DNA methylase [Bacteroidales bacterium]
MSLFQKSVEKKHLNDLDSNLIDKKFADFQNYFGNPTRQENIRNSKEEQFQEGFLRELFVKILGYTLNPEPNFNLTTELKNIANSKKADGAILKEEDATAVIELKGTDTNDLDKIETQAFGYKNHHPKCKYVITSNFEKLRFYIQNAVDHVDFDLFNLSREQFSLLWLCLSKDNLLSDLPLKIKELSVLQEENITKKLYSDYSKFREAIYNNLVKNNPESNKLLLFKKTQKLLDRFLFIFFAEDRLLVPPNSISQIIEKWKDDVDFGDAKPLYHTFKKYFHVLNVGRPKSGNRQEIFAYNGGLFKPDEILDNINIDDDILHEHALRLSNYDFETDVDVNILGHIFEHSLGEIENVQAEIKGEKVDSQKTKRKKDGIFYTPKYITKYIVENTVGKLCEEKRTEFGIVDEEYAKGRKTRKKEIVKSLDKNLDDYRNWLLSLTILDPACGSGAFLNQALEFLINEHRKIDELRGQLLGGAIIFSNISTDILEKNIYGVDLNEESVEIAKLSLWLRTAQKGRKLNTLSDNIKCGNSLIDDSEVAGEKAFNWQNEFPEIFAKGGFDVVIGNPPYVDIKGLEPNIVKALFEKYSTTENRINLYSIFIEKGHSILKNKGFFSFINPNSILVNSSYTKIRKLLVDDITTIIKLPDDVFPDAKVETIIFEFRKGGKNKFANTLVYPKETKIQYIEKEKLVKQNKRFWKQSQSTNYNIYVSDFDISLIQKCEENSVLLEKIADFSLGITPYDKYQGHSQETIKNRLFHSKIKLGDFYKPLMSGGNITRYYISSQIEEFIKYGNWLGAMREERFFTEPRIIIRQIVSGKPPRIYAGFTDQSYYFTQIGFGIIPKSEFHAKYLLTLLNSSLLTYYHKYKFLDLEKELFQKILIANCKQFPIKQISIEVQQNFMSKADIIIELNKELQIKKERFINRIKTNFEIEKATNKLDSFYDFDFKTFLSELKKQKVNLSLAQQDEWEEYFNSYKSEINQIQSEIEITDKEIDQMVYKLYGLTEEEIKIVEGTV